MAYEVGDHVYVSLPFNKRAGEPYLVARIQDFIRPKPGEASTSSSPSTRVKLAFYLRPRDVTTRYVADHRVLYATMHSDISPMSYIRGKCRVMHRDQLPIDIETYKREPDSFYYHQLYDRYLHRYFDIVPTDRVRNAPAKVLDYLTEHFEYVCCEVGMANELCDSLRGCVECHKWASNAESVTCALCRKIWHLTCTDPPLPRKPTAGYGWSCAPCAAKYEEDVEVYIAGGSVTNKPAAILKAPLRTGKGRGSPSDDGIRTPRDKIRSTNGWPFRYFGQHTDPLNILDPHDSYYPRASTRIGQKFQLPLSLLDPEAAKEERPLKRGWNLSVGEKRSRGGHSLGKGKQSAIYERGGDETIDVVCKPPKDSEIEIQLESLVASTQISPLYKAAGVALLDRALTLFHTSTDAEVALQSLERLTMRELGVAEWSEAEQQKFEEGLEEFQDDLEELARTLPRKRTADVVHHYYVSRPDLQNKLDQQHDDDKYADGVAPTGMTTDEAPPTMTAQEADSRASSPVPPATLGPCALCGEEKLKETAWYKCPSAIGESNYRSGEKVLCQECSIQWRHYGSNKTKAEEEARTARARKLAEPKLPKGPSDKSQRSEPAGPPLPPPPPPKPLPIPKNCVMCKKMEPRISLATCSRCAFSGHFTCCGIPSDIDPDEWLCDMCAAWDVLRRPPPKGHCAVCPPRVLKKPEEVLNALDLLKTTVDFGYVHLPCAIVHSEMNFGDPVYFQQVEGSVAIPLNKWQRECFVCNQRDAGACVKCADCNKFFHVSCAWSSNFKFAFEIHPVKKKKQVQQVSITFKTETGAMEPKIWCKSHRLKPDRLVYDFQEKDPETMLSAMQTYARYFKTVKPADSHALIRRGLRLDAILGPALLPPPPPPIVQDDPIFDTMSAIAALEGIPGTKPRSTASGRASKPPSGFKPKSRAKPKPKKAAAAPKPVKPKAPVVYVPREPTEVKAEWVDPYVYDDPPSEHASDDDYKDRKRNRGKKGTVRSTAVKAKKAAKSSAYSSMTIPPPVAQYDTFVDRSPEYSNSNALPRFANRSPDPGSTSLPPFASRPADPLHSSAPFLHSGSTESSPPLPSHPLPPFMNGSPVMPQYGNPPADVPASRSLHGRLSLDAVMANRSPPRRSSAQFTGGQDTPASTSESSFETDMLAPRLPMPPMIRHSGAGAQASHICSQCGASDLHTQDSLCDDCAPHSGSNGGHRPISPANARYSLSNRHRHASDNYGNVQPFDDPVDAVYRGGEATMQYVEVAEPFGTGEQSDEQYGIAEEPPFAGDDDETDAIGEDQDVPPADLGSPLAANSWDKLVPAPHDANIPVDESPVDEQPAFELDPALFA